MFRIITAVNAVKQFLSRRCPACKRDVGHHLNSQRYPLAPDGSKRIPVVMGRCFPDGRERPGASQKLSWCQLSEQLTLEEYFHHYGVNPPPLEACPGCGEKLEHHGKYWRGLELQMGWIERLPIYRGLCPNPYCPVVTVTHYPWFVVPYTRAPAQVLEAVGRGRSLDRIPWEDLSARTGYAVKTLARWCYSLRERAGEAIQGLLFLEQEHVPLAQMGIPLGESVQVLFQVADRVVEDLAEAGIWRREMPLLSLPRLPCPHRISTLPVWIW